MNAENRLDSFTLRYFAAMNSSRGFVNYFDDIFSSLNQLYIIKGGPGTGKSYLMQKVAQAAKEKNYAVEYYYCSSDPHSLDGILIPSLSIGMIDGTAPHTCDPKYPGVGDRIINLGDFWNTEKLYSYHGEIHALVDTKKQLFVRAYHYLSAAGMLDHENRRMIDEALLSQKLVSAVQRQTREMRSGSGYQCNIRLCDAISMSGLFHLDTYEKCTPRCLYLRDKWGIGSHYLHALVQIAQEKHQPILLSYDPLLPTLENAVCFPEYGLSAVIIPSSVTPALREKDTIINLDRFVDHEILRRSKTKQRFTNRCRKSMMEGAVETFTEIKKVHFRLEEIYTDAMDFKAKEEFTQKLIDDIFAAL